MNHKTMWVLWVGALIAPLLAAAFWHHDHDVLDESRAQIE